MHPKGASKNRDDHAIFSNDGPNLISPELTNNPSVIPKRYKLRNRNKSGNPNFKIDTPIEERLALSQEPILLKSLSKL